MTELDLTKTATSLHSVLQTEGVVDTYLGEEVDTVQVDGLVDTLETEHDMHLENYHVAVHATYQEVLAPETADRKYGSLELTATIGLPVTTPMEPDHYTYISLYYDEDGVIEEVDLHTPPDPPIAMGDATYRAAATQRVNTIKAAISDLDVPITLSGYLADDTA